MGDNAELITHLSTMPSVNAPRLLFIWGDAGTGKTHLLKAITQATNQRGEFVSAANELLINALPFILAAPSLPPVLAIDNIELLAQSALDTVFALQNRVRQSEHCSLVISSGLSPAQLALALEPRSDIVSRLSWGLTLRVHALTDDNKVAALSHFLNQRGTQYSADVLNYLLTHQSRNIKDLALLLDHIDRYAFSHKRAITIPLVKQFLSTQL